MRNINTNIDSEEIEQVIEKSLPTDKKILTEQEENFIRFYVETLNKRQSYRDAYNNGVSKSHDNDYANALLDRPEIGRRVSILIQKNLDMDVAKSPSLLLKYIERYLELDPATFYTDDGEIIPLSQLPPEHRLLISNINKQVNNRTGEVLLTYQLPDKFKLLDYLAKLVTFVGQVRALTGNTGNDTAAAEKKRNEIFNKGKKIDAEVKDIQDEIEKKKQKT